MHLADRRMFFCSRFTFFKAFIGASLLLWAWSLLYSMAFPVSHPGDSSTHISMHCKLPCAVSFHDTPINSYFLLFPRFSCSIPSWLTWDVIHPGHNGSWHRIQMKGQGLWCNPLWSWKYDCIIESIYWLLQDPHFSRMKKKSPCYLQSECRPSDRCAKWKIQRPAQQD